MDGEYPSIDTNAHAMRLEKRFAFIRIFGITRTLSFSMSGGKESGPQPRSDPNRSLNSKTNAELGVNSDVEMFAREEYFGETD